jgi:hypothetical protein
MQEILVTSGFIYLAGFLIYFFATIGDQFCYNYYDPLEIRKGFAASVFWPIFFVRMTYRGLKDAFKE